MFGLFVDGVLCLFFFFKQKPAYELRISDWSSDVCSSDLRRSSRPSYTQRIPPAVKRVLPPRSASGARSRTSTCAPFCAAALAAHIAPLPAPTDRKRVVQGKRVAERVDPGGRRHVKKQTHLNMVISRVTHTQLTRKY